LVAMQNDLSRLFGDFFRDATGQSDETPSGQWHPPMDVSETPDAFVIRAEIPGVEKDQLELSVENGVFTVRGERQGGEVVYVESSVARMNLKSIVARITRRPANAGQVPLKAYGAVWSDGTDVAKVEVKVDGGPWREATLDKEPRSKYCWTFFSIDLGTVPAGKHVVVSRAVDVNGRVQPAAEDDEIALKKTYWEANQQWPREIDVKA